MEDRRRVSDLWFPDADLLIETRDRIFRVPGSILAETSETVRWMIGVGPNMYGEPKLVLSSNPAHVEYLLRAIFYPWYFPAPPARINFRLLNGVLRLSTEFNISHLRQPALRHLSLGLPTTLKDFDEIWERDSTSGQWAADLPLKWLVARDLRIYWALPFPLLILFSILDEHPDYLMELSSEVRVCFMEARKRLRVILSNALDTLDLTDAASIIALRTAYSTQWRYAALIVCITPDLWDEGFAKLYSWRSRGVMKARFQLLRQGIWDGLPQLSGFSSWDALKAARDADLGTEKMPPMPAKRTRFPDVFLVCSVYFLCGCIFWGWLRS
ncbi:hypothetical protein FB45DRAFT_1067720 [Roridomyces roridus]|uniref:Uncharacterized protein n=1 Tax=Roridomyces roridus TaxID=1738132 RepID=A0AAD7F7X3_9AGAR|nr:hypothetical protein FB45DRAFT_1067720 [Roridomyces roridus]